MILKLSSFATHLFICSTLTPMNDFKVQYMTKVIISTLKWLASNFLAVIYTLCHLIYLSLINHMWPITLVNLHLLWVHQQKCHLNQSKLLHTFKRKIKSKHNLKFEVTIANSSTVFEISATSQTEMLNTKSFSPAKYLKLQ